MARVRLGSSREILALLNLPGVRSATEQAAEAVAENVRAQNIMVEGVPGDVALPVTTQVVQTDRPHAIVALAHPSGDAVQAKHGALTKAAGQVGLDVNTEASDG